MSASSFEQELTIAMPGSDDSEHPDSRILHSSYGVASVQSGIESLEDVSSIKELEGPGLAQQELVARALSPQAFTRSPASTSGSCQGVPTTERLVMPRTTYGTSNPYNESSPPSRSDTPMSIPSQIPAPSNPSSTLEDIQTTFPGPSLVMPSVQTSLRRQYTDCGRRIGRLKVAFCGDTASGKTTLLHTIAKQSPDIVHFEDTSGSEPGRTTTEIHEVQASSQPYPLWKQALSEHSEHSSHALERNLCLVDTPGYALSAEADDAIYPILRYLESQFEKTNDLLSDSVHLHREDFLNLIASPQGGFTQVDAAVYCITKVLTETDLEFIHNLTTFTTVIPVITKYDISQSESEGLQTTVKAQLLAISFPFSHDPLDSQHIQPFLVSCTDPEIEASIMMKDDYLPHLVESDFPVLAAALFRGDNPARLRHLTAQKFLAWKTKYKERSLILRPESDMALLPSADFTISRIAEHTRQEDQKTRLRIAAWAKEMRASFAGSVLSESNTFKVNQSSVDWLMTRMNDYVEDEKRADGARNAGERYFLKDESDPFGLLGLRERWSRRLRRAFKWLCDISFTSCGLYLLYTMWDRINTTTTC